MTEFKDRLWRELVRDHGAELAQLRRPAAAHGRRARPRVLAGTTLGLAGVGTTVALILSAASTTPAFAVTQNRDGSVSVKIMRLAGIQGANAKLRALGVRARLVAASPGCATASLPPAAGAALADARRVRTIVFTGPAAQPSARIDPHKIPLDRTLVLAAARLGRKLGIGNPRWAKGAVPACLPVITPTGATGPRALPGVPVPCQALAKAAQNGGKNGAPPKPGATPPMPSGGPAKPRGGPAEPFGAPAKPGGTLRPVPIPACPPIPACLGRAGPPSSSGGSANPGKRGGSSNG